jgi:RNA polymerase sigma-70 factor (ECF subfamily)
LPAQNAVQATVAGDEADLVQRLAAKDEAAVRTTIRRYNQRLYRLARSVVRDDGEAEDVLQQAYFKAFTHIDTFRGEAQLSTWLSRIVLNEALARIAQKRRANTVALEAAAEKADVIPFPNASPPVDPERSLAQRQVQALLEEAIDRLPDGFRTVLVARVVEGMSVEETAEVLGVKPETVKTRLHRARAMLRDNVENKIGPFIMDAFPFAGRRCDRLTEAVLKRLGYA